MKNILLIGLKLTAICAVASLSLAMVNAATAPRIANLKIIALEEALSEINNEGKPGSEILIDDSTVKSYYPVKLENGETASYILALIGNGYAGDLAILANYEKNGKLISCVLMDNQETPGLGKEAEKSEYMDKFIGTGSDKPLPVKKSQLPPDEADAIGGATMTFTGIAKALEYGSVFVKKIGVQP
ncbi:MAG: FMN-binding protein [Spirochaetia bacterium]|jgi:electron transport complex protein RnfG|nr:FMN-binding protein [Spirochaetia bacterium]